jgi:hypothetical protein
MLKSVVMDGLRLPAASAVFVVPEKGRVPIPNDASFQDIASEMYGEVSRVKPLQILVAGDWTMMDSDKTSIAFDLWLCHIKNTDFLPPLPPVDETGKFKAYPTFISTLEEWVAVLVRFYTAVPTTEEGRTSIVDSSSEAQHRISTDSPPPYESYPAYKMSSFSEPYSVVPGPSAQHRPRHTFFERLWTFFCS